MENPDTERSGEFAVFETAATPLEAELIAGIVREAGIPAFVTGSMLADEFALSQRLMHLGSITIQVPRHRLRDAAAAIEEARAGAIDLEDAASATAAREPASATPASVAARTGDPGRRAGPQRPAARERSGPGWILTGSLAIAAVAFLSLWLDTRTELRTLQNGVPERVEETFAGGTVVFVDADQDRRSERIEQRDRTGRVVRAWTWHDDAGFTLER
ncbi:MAG: hypothetical protein R3F56_05350 [Planctomycetota bacterium]